MTTVKSSALFVVIFISGVILLVQFEFMNRCLKEVKERIKTEVKEELQHEEKVKKIQQQLEQCTMRLSPLKGVN